MSLLPPSPTVNSHVVDVAIANKAANLEFIRSCADRVHANVKACWCDSQHTPQQFLDQYGTSAKAAMEMSRALTVIVMQYQTATGIQLLDSSLLALAGNWQGNDDGTVTVL